VDDRENLQKEGVDDREGKLETVACRHICFRYGQNRLLEDTSLTIRAHDFLGIQGDSGKGKTTLFNIILGFVGEERGEVWINGRRVDAARRKMYWNRIAYVKQQPFVLHDTILVNITLDENNYDEERLQKAITLSGLDEVLKKMPDRLRTCITEQGRNISGGQRQRIALARAIYKDADLILLDEPFSELDEASGNLLLERFAQLAREGKMVAMITHNKQSLSYCNATLSLDEASSFTRQDDQLWKYESNKK
jgi:ABC-type bacteriocin/lantibiotic exporter with double-glycine peptidase domain